MIVTKTVTTSWMPSNREHLIAKGYPYTKMRDKLDVKVEDLMPQSASRIRVCCDYCQKEYEVTYLRYIKSLNTFQPIQKVGCNACKYRKNKEILQYKLDHDLLTPEDSGYFLLKKNRVAFIKEYIEKNGDLKNLTYSKEGWKIIRFLNKSDDDLREIVEELGYKYHEMVSIKYNYYENFDVLERNIRDLIEKLGRFPFGAEINKELKCTDHYIAMHGGMEGIINKMNYNREKELIDDSGYFNKSSYEYIVAQFLLKNQLSFKRDQNPFPEEEKNYKSDFAFYPKNQKEIHIEIWGFGTDEYQVVKKEKKRLYKKYAKQVQLISLEKSLFRKKYEVIQQELIEKLNHLFQIDLHEVENHHLVPTVMGDEDILEELMQYSEDQLTLPKYEELRKVKKERLFDEAVRRHGSYMAFADKYRLKVHGKNKGYWSEEVVFEQLEQVLKRFGSVTHYTSTGGKCDIEGEFKGLNHYIRKIGERNTKLTFFLHCTRNAIPLAEKDLAYVQKIAKFSDKKYEEIVRTAKTILNENEKRMHA